MKIDFDIDIDMADREAILKVVDHIPASQIKDGEYIKHNTGVYFQTIPILPIEGIAAVDYKTAENQGWFKVDFLNNSIYENVRDEQHLDVLVNTEPTWELLEHPEVVEQLAHIHNYAELVSAYKPRSIVELAMLLAIIRPAKRHLQGLSWNEISKTVWDKPADGSYYFKKSHAHAYAASIVVQLNLLSGL